MRLILSILKHPLAQHLRSSYPFTPVGTLATVFAVLLSLRGYSYSSSYELLVGLIAISALAATAAAVRMERRRRENLGGEIHTPLAVQAGVEQSVAELAEDERATPLFLRIHLRVKARLYLGGDAVLHLSGEESGLGTGPVEVRMLPSVAGVLRSELRSTVNDCFGLCSLEIRGAVHRSCTVLPAPYPHHREYSLAQTSGNENRRLVKNAEEERYLMREYSPGDRVRDINWKASSRLPVLLTRVSPESQEESLVLPVLFLRGKQKDGETLQSVAERSHRLSWLLYFVTALLNGSQRVEVQLLIAEQQFLIGSIDDLHSSLNRIVGCSIPPGAYPGSHEAHAHQAGPGEISTAGRHEFEAASVEGLCVFASAGDPAYQRLSRMRASIETRYFLTQPPDVGSMGAAAAGAAAAGAAAAGAAAAAGKLTQIDVLKQAALRSFGAAWVWRPPQESGTGPLGPGPNYERDCVPARRPWAAEVGLWRKLTPVSVQRRGVDHD